METNNKLTNIRNKIRDLLLDKKIEDIREFDLTKNNKKLSDVCFIGSGTSSRHTQAVADHLYKVLKDVFDIIPDMSGDAKCGWVVVEASGVEVHLFKPEVRKYYDIEELLSSESDNICCDTIK